MTAEAALKSFFESFGIPGYPVSAVPDNAELPYLTYDAPVAYFEEGDCACVVNIWYKTSSESVINAKARELAEAIGRNGTLLPVDGNGYIWLKRGSPWCQPIADDSDITLKRRYINITLDYLR